MTQDSPLTTRIATLANDPSLATRDALLDLLCASKIRDHEEARARRTLDELVANDAEDERMSSTATFSVVPWRERRPACQVVYLPVRTRAATPA